MKWLLAFVSLLLMAQGPAPRVPPIVAPGPTGVAAADVAAIQGALNSVTSSGGVVQLSPGTYAINKGLVVKSGTHIECAPGTTLSYTTPFTTNGSDTAAIFQNANWNASQITDHDIWVTGCQFSAPANYGVGQGNGIYFQYVEHVKIDGVTCSFMSDCTAMLGSDDTTVQNSRCVEGFNACFDHWNHPSNVFVINNVMTTQTACILVTTGGTASPTAGITSGVVISGNNCTVTGGVGPGALTGGSFVAIWAPQSGAVANAGISNVRILNNVINMGATSFTGAISGTTLTVAGTCTGTPLGIGSTIATGATSPSGGTPTIITQLGTGSGCAGTYTVSQSQSVGSGAMTAGTQETCMSLNGSGTDILVSGNQCLGGLRQSVQVVTKGGGVPSNVMFANNVIDGAALVTSVPLIDIEGDGGVAQGNLATNVSGHSYALQLGGAGNQAINNTIPIGTSGEYNLAGTNFYVVDQTPYAWSPVLSFGGASVGITYGTDAGTFRWMGKQAQICVRMTLTNKGSSTGGALISGFFTAFGVSASSATTYNQGQLADISFTNSFAGSPTLPIAVRTQPATGSFFVQSTIDGGTVAVLTNANFANTTAIAFCGQVAFD